MSDAEVITSLYTAFQHLDGEAMASCYGEDAEFTDPVFPLLRGRQVGDMWRMLTSSAKGFTLTFDEVTDTSAHWVAHYTFTATGREVVNDVHSTFEFSRGLIHRQEDSFDFWRWSRQALGPVGLVLGWSPIVRGKVRSQAMAGLGKFQQQG